MGLLVSALLLCHARSGSAQLAARGSQASIVLIVADDLGFADLGCYGSEILTPSLDRLARDGLRFTQFYNCGRSCPTRAALLTGLYPHQAGVGHMMNDYRRPGYRGNLNNECATIAQVLKTAGYQTFMAGKWHVSRYIAPGGPKYNWPLQRGFDRFYGTIHVAGSYFDPVTLCRDNHFIKPPEGPYYYTDAMSDAACQYVEQAGRSKKPFFLYVAYTAPHWPLHAPSTIASRYRAKYALGWDELRKQRHRRMIDLGVVQPRWPLPPRDPRVGPWEQQAQKSWQQRRMEIYAAQIDLMDQGIGRIVDRLRQSGALRNTVMMFLSDNGASAEEISDQWQGPHIPERTRRGRGVVVGNRPGVDPGPEETYQSYGVAWAAASNTPFRLYKHYVHEGGIASPLVVYWPEVIRSGGGMTHEIGHVVDIMPTCLEVARLPYPRILGGYTLKPLEGRSLVAVFRGGKLPQRTLCWEHEGNKAVRDGKWKLVAYHRGDWELYDMQTDRTEMNNLARRYPAIVEDLTRAYDAWAKRCNVEPWRK